MSLCLFQNGHTSELKQLFKHSSTIHPPLWKWGTSSDNWSVNIITGNLPARVHECGFTNISPIPRLSVKTMHLASLHFCLFVLSASPSLFLIGCMAPSFHPSMASSQWGDGIGFLLDKALPLVVVETMRWGRLPCLWYHNKIWRYLKDAVSAEISLPPGKAGSRWCKGDSHK